MNKFTIVVNTYPYEFREEDLSRCLSSLSKQKFDDFKVLIIENAPPSNKVKDIATKCKLKNFEIIFDATKKLSYLFNLGFKNTKTEFIAFIADDAEAEPDWLLNIYNALNADEKIGVVTGPIVSTCYPAGEMHRLYLLSQKNIFTKLLTWPYMHFVLEDKPLAPGNLFKSGAYSLGAGLKESVNFPKQEIDLATTSSMGARTKCLNQINGFDENFWFNHADGDLFIRIKKAGWKVLFDPTVIAHHHVRLGPSRNSYIIGRDTGLFYKKHIRPKGLTSLIGILINTLVLNMYWIYNSIRTKDYMQLKGIYGFFEGLL